MMRGRKPTPTHLKPLHGNPGNRSLNGAEPKPERRAPDLSFASLPSAKAEWKRLAAQLIVLRILTELDRAALAAYCQAYGRWVEAGAQAAGNARAAQAALRLRAAKPVADHRQQAARTDA
jgi:phage terminase small subunit